MTDTYDTIAAQEAGADWLAQECRKRDTAIRDLREALSNAETWMLRITDEVLDGEGVRSEYNAAREQIRAVFAKSQE